MINEMSGGLRKLTNNEVHNLHSTPSTIGMIKSRKSSWAGHVTGIGEKRNVYRTLVEKTEGKTKLKKLNSVA
jgi:hypothetical protein